MKLFRGAHAPAGDVSTAIVLPRSVGVLIAAFGTLLCWGMLIGLFQLFG